jgi:transcription antitermination protein NusB
MPRLRAETRARALALQALYAWDLRDGESLERIASQVWDDLAIAPDERAFAEQIVRTIIAEAKGIDDALRDVTTNWRLERLGAVERAVLRIAAAELLRGDPPPRVAIQEAVRLAERYGSAQSARFVNGVLDALARKMGRL